MNPYNTIQDAIAAAKLIASSKKRRAYVFNAVRYDGFRILTRRKPKENTPHWLVMPDGKVYFSKAELLMKHEPRLYKQSGIVP